MHEQAITLKEAAERLNVSYQTVYAAREQIAFRLPGSRIWRIWPSALDALSEKRNNLTRLSLRVGKEAPCPSVNTLIPASGGLIFAHQAASELDALLAPKASRQHRNTTTR